VPSFEAGLGPVAADRDSGSRAITRRVVELLQSASWPSPTPLTLFTRRARAILAALPTFALLHDLLHRTGTALARDASGQTVDPALLQRRLDDWLGDWETAQLRTTTHALGLVRDGMTLVTLSNSSAVGALLDRLSADEKKVRAVVGESLPGGEGRTFAELHRGRSHEVLLVADLDLPSRLGADSAVVLGADALFSGRFINKVGSAGLARAARSAGRPVWVLAESAKWAPDAWGVTLDPASGTEALFEPVDGRLVDSLVSEKGALPFERAAVQLDRKPVFQPLLAP
jgi:translation initiation factor 2B subunit (eIF-2B alpha/beta/delta family)